MYWLINEIIFIIRYLLHRGNIVKVKPDDQAEFNLRRALSHIKKKKDENQKHLDATGHNLNKFVSFCDIPRSSMSYVYTMLKMQGYNIKTECSNHRFGYCVTAYWYNQK